MDGWMDEWRDDSGGGGGLPGTRANASVLSRSPLAALSSLNAGNPAGRPPIPAARHRHTGHGGRGSSSFHIRQSNTRQRIHIML